MEITLKIDKVEELKELIGLLKGTPAANVTCEEKAKPVFRVFDENSLAWSRDSEMNRYFLMQQQNYANKKLRQRGYLFLNEVYDMLGLSRTKTGQTDGWVYDKHKPWNSDVDFGLFTHQFEPMFKDRNHVCLVFNVDGNILDRVWEEP